MVRLLFSNKMSVVAILTSSAFVVAVGSLLLLPVAVTGHQQRREASIFPDQLPFIGDLISNAFPTWCIDEDERRIYDIDTCGENGTGSINGRFTPLYFTKQFSGMDPALGGYPTDIDIQYAFYYAAPFLGQACAGTPHHCTEDFDGGEENCGSCPKVKTDDDSGPNGPGHIPPHIALAALTRTYNEIAEESNITASDYFVEAFNYEQNACRILPGTLLSMIREFYPRDEETGEVSYPPPFSDAGGAYPYEFINVAGDSCEKEKGVNPNVGELICFEEHSGNATELYPPYLEIGHGSPHYCSKDAKAADTYNDFCPYIFFGPNRGQYRHPHIAFASVETYLANLVMPDKCGITWDDSNYPPNVDTSIAFPFMKEIDNFAPDQPLIEEGRFLWPGPEGTKKKSVDGTFATGLYVVDPPIDPPILGSSYCTYSPDMDCFTTGWPACCGDDSIECPDEQPLCEVPSIVGSSYCTYSPDMECFTTGWPACCGDDSIECPDEQPLCEITPIVPPIVGSSYCTYSPDMDCFTTGWPACCGDDSIECPDEQPLCEITPIEPPIVGSSYCTYSPDYSCYDSGWPECCGSDSKECPAEESEQPECDISPIVGESYCVYAPDPECYINWWPACCSDDSIECPKEKPTCEISPIFPVIPGSSYCTYGPEYSCYDSGWPECCGDDSIECPKEQPSCEIACKTLADIVCETPDLSELCHLVERAGLKDSLSKGSLTLFAPRNGGFDSIPIDDFSKDRLKRLILFHIVANEELYSSDLSCTSTDNLIIMSNGFESRTRCENGIPTYQKGRDNSSNSPPIIVQDNIEACNGVAHVLSEVMLYKQYD